MATPGIPQENYSMPAISFIMPAFKKAFLAEAIKSIILQTSDDWELVIVDDASPECLKDVTDSFSDKRIRFFRNKENLGGSNLVKQWNHCIKYATGDFIVLAADDDIYEPIFCEEVQRLRNNYPHADLIRARVQQINESGNNLPYQDGVFQEFSSKYEYLHDWITAKAFTCIGNFAFRKSALLRIGGFIDFPCAFGSDIATPIALSINGVANTKDMLFKFRQSSNHLSGDCRRYKEKLEGISQLSEWLTSMNWPAPSDPEDIKCMAVASADYLHKKCIYDYFNLVIVNVPIANLPQYLKLCRLANFKEKCIMVLRWCKRRLIHKK